MDNERDEIMAEISARKIELTVAEKRLKDISNMTYGETDELIDKIDSMAGVRATLKIYGKILLALIKIIKKKLY